MYYLFPLVLESKALKELRYLIDILKMILVTVSLVNFVTDEDIKTSPDKTTTELLHSNTASHIATLWMETDHPIRFSSLWTYKHLLAYL